MMRGRLGWLDGFRDLSSGVYDTMIYMSNSVSLSYRLQTVSGILMDRNG